MREIGDGETKFKIGDKVKAAPGVYKKGSKLENVIWTITKIEEDEEGVLYIGKATGIGWLDEDAFQERDIELVEATR